MSFQHQGFEAVAGIEPERALNIGVGAFQAPLWAAFYASAGLGAAWWWSTAWTRSAPSFDFARLLAPEPQPAAEAYVEALDDAVCDLIETAQEGAEETVEVIEASADSVELAGETAVESVSYAVEQVEPTIAEAPDVAPEPLAAAAGEVVAEPVELAPARDLPVEREAFKPSKKKAPKAD